MLFGNIQSRRNSIWSKDSEKKEAICVSEVTLTRIIKTGGRTSSDGLLIMLMTERKNMPVIGFSLKPTEVQSFLSHQHSELGLIWSLVSCQGSTCSSSSQQWLIPNLESFSARNWASNWKRFSVLTKRLVPTLKHGINSGSLEFSSVHFNQLLGPASSDKRVFECCPVSQLSDLYFQNFKMKNPVTRSSPGAVNLHTSRNFYTFISLLQYLWGSLTSEN